MHLVLLMSIASLCDIYHLESFVYKHALFVYTMTIMMMIISTKYHHDIHNGLLALQFPIYVWSVISIILAILVCVYCQWVKGSIPRPMSMSERVFAIIILLPVGLLLLIMVCMPHRWDIEKCVSNMLYLMGLQPPSYEIATSNSQPVTSHGTQQPPPSYETAISCTQSVTSHGTQQPPPSSYVIAISR
jgi:amino acid transporter